MRKKQGTSLIAVSASGASGADVESSFPAGALHSKQMEELKLELTFSILHTLCLLDSWPAYPCMPRAGHQTPNRGLSLGHHKAPVSVRAATSLSLVPRSHLWPLLLFYTPFVLSSHLLRKGIPTTLLAYTYLLFQGEHLLYTPGFLLKWSPLK